MEKKIFWASALVIISFYGASAKLSDYFSILPENYFSRVPEGLSRIKEYNDNNSYCFHFTWMGSSYDNRTYGVIENKTCEQYFSETGVKPMPLCVDPMVATWYGGQPNHTEIWNDYGPDKGEGTSGVCRLSEDRVCAKYSVYYNGVLANVTRYCTRINVAYESSMQSGCITENRGTYTIEVCACRSDPNDKYPCNSSHRSLISYNLLILFFIISLHSMRQGCYYNI